MSTTPQLPDPQQLQQSTDAISAPNVAQMRVQNPQQPQVPVANAGMVKQFLTNYFGNVAAQLTGTPNSYTRRRQDIQDTNATVQAQNKALLEQAQAKYNADRNPTAMAVAQQKLSGVMAGVNQKLADSGYELVPDGQGGFVQQSIPMERLSEKAKTTIGFEQAKTEYNNAQSELDKAKADVLMNPNNPTFVQKAKEIQAKLAMAQQNLLLRAAGNQRQEVQFGINNGVMPNGAAPTVVGNGQLLGDNNQPIGKNFQNFNAPTAATRTAGEQGQIINKNGTGLISYISAHRNELGSMDAILNVAFNHTPAANPVQSEAASRVASFAALQPRLHGLRGKAAQDEFKSLIGPNYTNPDAMIGGIKGMMGTASDVSAIATPKTTANTKKDSLGIF